MQITTIRCQVVLHIGKQLTKYNKSSISLCRYLGVDTNWSLFCIEYNHFTITYFQFQNPQSESMLACNINSRNSGSENRLDEFWVRKDTLSTSALFSSHPSPLLILLLAHLVYFCSISTLFLSSLLPISSLSLLYLFFISSLSFCHLIYLISIFL